MYVQSISSGVLAPGQQLTIWGGFFVDACQVLFNGIAGVIEDVNDGAIVAVCPDELGDYSVQVKNGAKVIDAGTLRVVELSETPLPSRPREYALADFVSYVRGLFPRGNVLDLQPSSNFGKFIKGLALSVQYLWGQIQDMFVALDPAHTSNFDDWEDDLGLPVNGIIVNNFEDRRREIYRVACTPGGCTKPYFKKVLRLMGYEADVSEYYKDASDFTVTTLEYTDNDDGTTSCQSKNYTYSFPETADRKFYWQIRLHVPDLKIGYADCENSTCESFLVQWEDYVMENVINAIKPAHTVCIFIYDNMNTCYLTDETRNILIDEYGDYLVYYR